MSFVKVSHQFMCAVIAIRNSSYFQAQNDELKLKNDEIEVCIKSILAFFTFVKVDLVYIISRMSTYKRL